MKLDGVFLRSLRLVRFNNMPTKTHFNFMQTLPSLDVGLSKADFVRGLHTSNSNMLTSANLWLNRVAP
jgi:hypothetical protein